MKKLKEQLSSFHNKINKSDWESVSFGDVSKEVRETINNKTKENIKHVVGLENLLPLDIHIRSWSNIEEGTTFSRKFKKGQILFAKRRAYQRKAATADFDGVCSGDILVLETNEERMENGLLSFLVHSDGFFNQAISTSAGSLSPRTKYRDLSKYKFLLPPRKIQKELSKLLWSADNLENIQLNLIEEKKLFKKILTNELLTNGIKLKKNNGKWPMVKIGDFVTLVKDRGNIGEHPYIEIGDIDIISKEYSFKDKESVVGCLRASRNNLIISKVRPTRGAISIVKEDNLVVSGAFSVLKTNKLKLNSGFLFLILYNNNQFFDYLGARSTGTTYPTCSDDDIMEFKIPLPPIEVQKEISNILFKFDNDLKKTIDIMKLIQKLKFSVINTILK